MVITLNVEKYKSNKQLQVVLNNINLSILFAKKPYTNQQSKSATQGVFGFSNGDIEIITKAIRRGINIAEKLDKYVFEAGVSFLQCTSLKQKFINEIIS